MAETVSYPVFPAPVLGSPERHRPHSHRRAWQGGGALALSVALMAGATGSAPAEVTGAEKSGAAAGVAARNPLVPGGVLSSASPSATARPSAVGSPSPKIGGEGGGAYDTSHNISCDATNPSRPNKTTLHVRPKVTIKSGHPNPSRFVTVATLFQVGATAERKGIWTAPGIGSPVDVATPSDLQFPRDMVTVETIYFPPNATMPATPEGFALDHNPAGAVRIACGNAVVDYLMANGGVQIPGQQK